MEILGDIVVALASPIKPLLRDWLGFSYVWLAEWLVIFITLALVGVAIALWGYRMQERVKEYDFENRTAGGVVEFSDYRAARRHRTKEALADAVNRFGWFLTMPLFFLLLFTGISSCAG